MYVTHGSSITGLQAPSRLTIYSPRLGKVVCVSVYYNTANLYISYVLVDRHRVCSQYCHPVVDYMHSSLVALLLLVPQELVVVDDVSGRMNTVNPLTVQVVPTTLSPWSQQPQQQPQVLHAMYKYNSACVVIVHTCIVEIPDHLRQVLHVYSSTRFEGSGSCKEVMQCTMHAGSRKSRTDKPWLMYVCAVEHTTCIYMFMYT